MFLFTWNMRDFVSMYLSQLPLCIIKYYHFQFQMTHFSTLKQIVSLYFGYHFIWVVMFNTEKFALGVFSYR